MSDRPDTRLSRWQSFVFFLFGAVLFDGLAVWVMLQSQRPLSIWHASALVVCVAGGAWLSVQPFLWDAKVAFRREEQQNLRGTLEQVQNLEKVAAQVAGATNTWSFAQDQAGKTVEAANQIAARMAAEVKGFAEFMQKANDSEKAALRLEVEKLHRSQADSLQIIVRMLDHTWALHQAAQRSGQPALAQNLTQFQNACRDAARRIGLLAFAPAAGEAFDPELHQLADEKATAMEGSLVSDIVATGYTYQGQLIRPALVTLQNNSTGAAVAATEPTKSEIPTEQPSLL